MLSSCDAAELAALRNDLLPELDDLIRVGAVGMAVQFAWPTLQARVEVTYGGWIAISPLEEGQALLRADFRFSSEEDEDEAVWDILHEVRYLARTEVVTIDQRALLAVGELLARDAGARIDDLKTAHMTPNGRGIPARCPV